MSLTQAHTTLVKSTAAQLGFDYCGIARALPLDEDARRLEAWLNKGMHGTMHYMEKYFDQRINPALLVPGARSVITLLKNYFPAEKQQPGNPKIASYAYGNDYHEVIKNQLNQLLQELQESIGAFNGRGFVDSAPVLERSWAKKTGLGWIGKNGNLIHKQSGSYFFIATLIVDVELEYDHPLAKDYCGSCTRCIDACPTQAILPDKVVDGSKCISYLTIELKEAIPSEFKHKMDNWAFGCDVCQDVCPWNSFSQVHREPQLKNTNGLIDFSKDEWYELSEELFNSVFKHSAIKRTKYKGLKRNLEFLKKA